MDKILKALSLTRLTDFIENMQPEDIQKVEIDVDDDYDDVTVVSVDFRIKK